MGATGKSSNPQVNEPTEDATSWKDSLESTMDWIIKSGPRWARIPALLVTIAVTLSSPIVATRNWLFPVKPDPPLSASDPAAGQLDMTSIAKASVDYAAINTVINQPNATEEERSKAQIALATTTHRLAHLSNVKDAGVPWIIFGKKSANDYFAYKFFQSDKCLLISRVENGQGTAEWLSDPNQPVSPASAAAAGLPSTPTRHALPAALEATHPDDVHLLQAAWGEDRKISIQNSGDSSLLNSLGLDRSPAQTGCINPHPGTPTVATGAPINSCQTPTFRKWADGCSQVQIYDQCKKVWGPVVWQACSNAHHG